MFDEMSRHSSFILVLLVCSMLFGTSDAVSCYRCSTDSLAGCGDPFDSAAMKAENVCHGATYCTKSTNTLKNDFVAVGRDCFVTGTVVLPACTSTFTSTAQGFNCFCDHDYCNLASRRYVNSYVVVAVISVSVVMHLLRRMQ